MRPDLAAQIAFRSRPSSLCIMGTAQDHIVRASITSIQLQILCTILNTSSVADRNSTSIATLQDGSTHLHFLSLFSTATMMEAPEARDVLNGASSCPLAARTQSAAWHASASFERPGAESLPRPSSRSDTQHKLPDAYQFLEEVRVRLFAHTPFTEGASAASSPQQAQASPSAADRLSIYRHAPLLGSARQRSSLGGDRCSPARQSLPSPCAAPQGRWPSLHASASGTAPALQALSKSVGKENVPAAPIQHVDGSTAATLGKKAACSIPRVSAS